MYIHRNFTHPGGVSPVKEKKQEKQGGDMVTASDGSSVPRANLEDYENSLKEAKKEVAKEEVKKFISKPIINENVLNVAPGSGEIVDAKNTVKDLIAGDYGGAALNAAGFAIPFVPGNVIKKGVKAVMNYIRKTPGAEDAIKKGTKTLDEVGSTGPKPKGGVDGDQARTFAGTKPKLQNYGEHSFENEKLMQDMLRKKSDNLDEFLKGKGDVVYNKTNTRYLGKEGGRPIYEVDLPNGETMKFYESTGWGGKVGSKGKFIPIEGTQTKYYPKGTKNKKGEDISGQPYEWFNKGGSKATYNNYQYEGFTDAKGNYVSVKEQLKRDGVDIAKELKSGKLKIDESGYDFQYGKAFSDISKQLENIYPSRL